MYNEVIIDHNNHPFNAGELANPDIEELFENSSCGDAIKIQLTVKNGVIIDGKFSGVGCAISKAATDMLLDEIVGKNQNDAKAVLENYYAMIMGTEYNTKKLGSLVALQNVAKMPARTKCALLPYQIINKV